MTEIKVPEHGVAFDLKLTNDVRQTMETIFKLQNTGSILLADLIRTTPVTNEVVRFPCRQCILDIALTFHDLSEAIKELAEG